jgi:hypothetical protein
MMGTGIVVVAFVAGIGSALIVEELLRAFFRRASYRLARTYLGRMVLRRGLVRRRKIESIGSRWTMNIGSVSTPWVVVGFGPYRHENIRCFFSPEEPTYPEDVERIYQGLCKELQPRLVLGHNVPFDGPAFKLVRFDASVRVGEAEEPGLVLHFAPTSYYRMLATDARLDVEYVDDGVRQTLRRKYAGDVDLRIKPVPELANYWNLGLSVVTSDRFLLVSERGPTAMDPDVFGPAVAEGVSRAKDSTASGAPDNLSAARRGMEEELGIPLDASELTWLSFGASSKDCEYVLIGCVFSRFSLDEVRRRRSVGVKDAWENKELHAVEFDPQAVAEFCSHGQRFSPYALACIVHTLIYEFGLRDTEAAFVSKHVRSSHDLPGWL